MPANNLTEDEVLAFLRSVERGEVTLDPQQEPQEIYAGNVEYHASNGWTITVFNDANEWDYIEQLCTADGRECHHEALANMPKVESYGPSSEVAWMRYRIPGYCKFRCTRCGQVLTPPFNPPYVCPKCKRT